MTVQDTQDTQATEFAAEWERWHKQHEDRLAAPDGFLAITSINWLSESPARFDDAPGAWAADDSGVWVILDDGEELELDGAVIRGRHHFGRIPERGGVFPRDAKGVYEVARRGGNDILRPRHPDNELRYSRVRAGPALGDPRPLPAIRNAARHHRRLRGRGTAARIRGAGRRRVRG
jgi:hypothetical protein